MKKNPACRYEVTKVADDFYETGYGNWKGNIKSDCAGA